ncbi:MAG: hypothetical protein ABSC90_02195 [Acidimicrobiales bacterium]|jgi:hypothetical protein
MIRRTSKWRTGGSIIGILAMVGTVSIGMIGMSGSVAGARTVKVKIPNYVNKLSSNTNGWCTPSQGCNGQGGNEADYGTIDIVKPSYDNYGGYGAHTPSPAGQKNFARITGAGLDQDTINGCPTPGYDASLNTPYCEGPYVCYGGSCSEAAFPTNGFTSSIMVYVDPTWAAANPGQEVDWDVGLNNTSGSYLNDNGFTMCTTAAGGGGFYVNLNQFSSCNSSAEELTAAGWYTLKQDFQSVAGQVVVTYSVTPPTGPVWSSVVNTGEATTATGGPSYGWFADEDVLGLPIAQISLKNN